MIRKFKTLGLALVAVLALGAVVASAAMAEGRYTASSYPANATATSEIGNDTFTTEAGTVECKSEFSSSASEASKHLTVIPLYTNCKAFGFATATVSMGSCDYTFTTPETTGTLDVWTAKVAVRCTNAAEPIKIVAGACEVQIGEHEPAGHVIITKTTSGARHLDFRATFTNVKYNVVKDGFLCPFSGTGAKEGATYTQHNEVTVIPALPGLELDIVHP